MAEKVEIPTISGGTVASLSIAPSAEVTPDTPAGPPRRSHGLSMLTAAVLIAGEMAGSGVLALPKAVADAGWIGLVLIAVCCLNSAYTGSRLGICWLIIEERYPEYRDSSPEPYPVIARKAVGRKMSIAVSICNGVSLCGTAIVFLLLSSQLVHSVLGSFSYCYWILIVGGSLIPFTWLGTPKDFWQIALGALISTTVACILIVTQIMLDKQDNLTPSPPKFKSPSVESLALAFGTILFAYGGANTFPTIQNDMKNRSEFTRSVFIASTALLMMYILIAASGYFIFGSDVKSSIVDSMSAGGIKIAVIVLLSLHLFCAFVIVLNPFCQEIEALIKVPEHFTWKRCAFRTLVVCFIIFIGESVPRFGDVLALVGGSTITLLTFVFPPLFYLRLCKQKSPGWPERNLPLHEKVYLWELIVIALIGGAAATWSAFQNILTNATTFTPCYMDPNSPCYTTGVCE